MKEILKSRWLLTAIGLILLALVIWFGGPYLGLGRFRPFESVAGRLVAILLLVIAWALYLQFRVWKSGRSAEKLAGDVAEQADAPVAKTAGSVASGDSAQLRSRFEEATRALRKDRKGGGNLYELPWYVIIGPPGAGKTTALVNSGLRFPLSKQFGKEALRGVGGTRNCDWWFTSEGVFLDTAGRFTTQDSDRDADSSAWGEFLGLLRKHRRRQPINGVLIAVSVPDLIAASDRELAALSQSVRERLDELNRHLRINLPVYLLVTKVDLIAGFNEFFDDLGSDGRAQVWGTTFPVEATESGKAAELFSSEFDHLVGRLNERLIVRLEEERDARRRTALFAFPQQVASIKPLIDRFLKEVFSSSGYDADMLLRGVYLTSGTQEGTPIDRMLAALTRGSGLEQQAVAPRRQHEGRAYFIERLLRDVVLKESGLAGTSRRAVLQRGVLQLGIYALAAGLGVGGALALFTSYRSNANYVGEVQTAVDALAATPRSAAPYTADSIDKLLPRLDGLAGVVDVATQYEDGVPWRMRWGLYQGKSIGHSATDAYSRELNATLAPAIADAYRQRLASYSTDPNRLYEYLKAYLMLGDAEHREAGQLAFLSRVEWEQRYPDRPDLRQSIDRHLQFLLAEPDRLAPAPLDDALIAQARAALKQASLPALVYSRLKLNYAGDTERALRLDVESGLGSESVLRRRSGVPLSEPVPAIYTEPVFSEITSKGAASLAKQFADESWVLGSDGPAITGSVELAFDVFRVYEDDYIRAWDEILADVTVVPVNGVEEAALVLGTVGSATSPLRGFLTTVAAQTNLEAEAPGEKAGAVGDAVSAAADAAQSQLGKVFESGAEALGATSAERPGSRVTKHFEPIHRLVAGPPGGAPIDRVLQLFGQIQQQLNTVQAGAGGGSPAQVLAQGGGADLLQQLQIETKMLPPAVGAIVAEVGGKSQKLAQGQVRSELGNLYREMVVLPCAEVVNGRYPFERSAKTDVPLADFGRVFGAGGIFDSFFAQNLAPLVDTSRSPWRWRPTAKGVGLSSRVLGQFEHVNRIRSVYFPSGGPVPEFSFNLTPEYLDAGATRFAMEVDGQSFEYRHGPQRSTSMKWPGQGAGQAAATLDTQGGASPNQVFSGPWALFRLLDSARIQPQTDTRFLLNFAIGGSSARVLLDAATIRNPLRENVLQGFSCGR